MDYGLLILVSLIGFGNGWIVRGMVQRHELRSPWLRTRATDRQRQT
jgi:hypothetical protein